MAEPSKTEYLASDGGYCIFTTTWQPAGDPKAIVHIVHGYGEHCRRYDDVAARLVAESYLVFSHDHYGHGSSDGEKGDVINFDFFVRDLLCLTKRESAAYPHLPLFVLAHSFGGMVALHAALKEPDFARGIILISPAIELSPEAASPLRIFLAKWVASICPNLVVMKIDISKISRDEAELKRIEEDPLCFKVLRAKFGIQVLHAQLDLISRLSELTMPFLVEHGSADGITDISGARLLLEKAASEDKSLVEIAGAFHQLHHELAEVKEETYRNLFRWIKDHL